MILIITGLFIILFLLSLDLFLKIKPRSKLKIIPIKYNLISNKKNNQIECFFEIKNFSRSKETMVSNLEIDVDLFDKDNLIDFNYKKIIIIKNGSYEKVINKYWPTLIIKSRDSLELKVLITFDENILDSDKSLWLKFQWENYGHFGIKERKNCFLISNHEKLINEKKLFNIAIDDTIQAIAIKTNLLGAFDDPVETISSYCEEIINDKDILIIGETPLAIMQGRYLSPQELEYSLFAKILCYFFHPTSSLATACGMQLLINKVGLTRVTFSLLVGFIFKLIMIKGIFYRLAGKQASLIDDISGTTAPYDKTIVLGPINSHKICKLLSERLKVDVAIADVNDLGKVKILASSNRKIDHLLFSALKNNPAGNDDQKTPILILRQKT